MNAMTSIAPATAARPWRRARLLNVWIDDLTMPELMDRLDHGMVATLNLDHLYHLRRNAQFAEAYANAEFVTADSKYVFWSLKLLGRGIRTKLSGSDIVPTFCRHHADDPKTSVFLLGAQGDIARIAGERINASVGRDIVVGTLSPSLAFASDHHETSAAIDKINASGATALIVGLGAPKQEIWIAAHRYRMPNVRVFMGVGATIDYEAGMVRRAPAWMHNGFEWLFRSITEPRRYARRYLRDMEFFWYLLLDALGFYRPPTFPKER